MKKYVFLTFAVSGVGGTQIYIRNKLLFLKHCGWETAVICTEPGHSVCVKELKPYENAVIPELMKNPYILTRKERGQVLCRMKQLIGCTDGEVVIESNFIQVNLWGELLAREIQGRHFAYLIQEDYSLRDLRYMKFYDFKYRRGELAGNTQFALKQLFEGYREIPDTKTGELTAVCYNVIEECESEHDSAIIDADYHIGSIGRVNKPFVNVMVQDVISFAKLHPDKTFQLVLYGGSPEQSDLDAVMEEVCPVPNLSAYITGPIFPVPRHLLDKMDVFISSAGAARTSSDAGYITITIDANDCEPIGILGYTTNDNVHRNPDIPHDSTVILLEDILIRRKYADEKPEIALSSPDYMEVFKTHMAYLAEAVPEKQYYDVKKLGPRFLTIVSHRLLGDRSAAKLQQVFKNMRGGK